MLFPHMQLLLQAHRHTVSRQGCFVPAGTALAGICFALDASSKAFCEASHVLVDCFTLMHRARRGRF